MESLAAAIASVSISKPKRSQEAPTPASIARPKTQRKVLGIEDKENHVADVDLNSSGVGCSATGGITPSRLDCFKALREELTCAVCLDICVRPCTTPCGHNYCRSCLRRNLELNRPCPKCRASLPSGFELHINTTLWNTIQMMFPKEVADKPPTPPPSGQGSAGAARTQPGERTSGALSNLQRNRGVAAFRPPRYVASLHAASRQQLVGAATATLGLASQSGRSVSGPRPGRDAADHSSMALVAAGAAPRAPMLLPTGPGPRTDAVLARGSGSTRAAAAQALFQQRNERRRSRSAERWGVDDAAMLVLHSPGGAPSSPATGLLQLLGAARNLQEPGAGTFGARTSSAFGMMHPVGADARHGAAMPIHNSRGSTTSAANNPFARQLRPVATGHGGIGAAAAHPTQAVGHSSQLQQLTSQNAGAGAAPAAAGALTATQRQMMAATGRGRALQPAVPLAPEGAASDTADLLELDEDDHIQPAARPAAAPTAPQPLAQTRPQQEAPAFTAPASAASGPAAASPFSLSPFATYWGQLASVAVGAAAEQPELGSHGDYGMEGDITLSSLGMSPAAMLHGHAQQQLESPMYLPETPVDAVRAGGFGGASALPSWAELDAKMARAMEPITASPPSPILMRPPNLTPIRTPARATSSVQPSDATPPPPNALATGPSSGPTTTSLGTPSARSGMRDAMDPDDSVHYDDHDDVAAAESFFTSPFFDETMLDDADANSDGDSPLNTGRRLAEELRAGGVHRPFALEGARFEDEDTEEGEQSGGQEEEDGEEGMAALGGGREPSRLRVSAGAFGGYTAAGLEEGQGLMQRLQIRTRLPEATAPAPAAALAYRPGLRLPVAGNRDEPIDLVSSDDDDGGHGPAEQHQGQLGPAPAAVASSTGAAQRQGQGLLARVHGRVVAGLTRARRQNAQS